MDEPREDRNPSEAHIAFCAHLIWEHEGRPEGREKIHWNQALDQLNAGYVHHQWYPTS